MSRRHTLFQVSSSFQKLGVILVTTSRCMCGGPSTTMERIHEHVYREKHVCMHPALIFSKIKQNCMIYVYLITKCEGGFNKTSEFTFLQDKNCIIYLYPTLLTLDRGELRGSLIAQKIEKVETQ